MATVNREAEAEALSRCLYVEKPKYLEPLIERPVDILYFIACLREVDLDVVLSKQKGEIQHTTNRQLAQAVAKAYSNKNGLQWSLKHIGWGLGQRDHATVLHSIKTVKYMIDNKDPNLGDITDILMYLGLTKSDF